MLFNGNSRIEKLGGLAYGRSAYGQTLDGWTDGQMDGQMDRWTDRWMNIRKFTRVLQDVGPLRPLPKKCSNRTLMHHMVKGF